jgi:hypothetical protein
MATKPKKKIEGKTVAEYVTFHLDACKRTQREIAGEIGYSNSNVITMFKQGLTKIPVAVAPKLAVAIGVDPGQFLRMVLNEYMPDLLPEIEKHVGGLCTLNELAMLKTIRTATKDKDPAMTPAEEKALTTWAKGLG